MQVLVLSKNSLLSVEIINCLDTPFLNRLYLGKTSLILRSQLPSFPEGPTQILLLHEVGFTLGSYGVLYVEENRINEFP